MGRTWLRRALGLSALGLVAILIVLGVRLGATLPRLSGRVGVAGLTRAIEVVRDAHGIPHVYAQSDRDAYFGLGYVHAQDRAFQIELQLRLASGTLSELIGETGIASDRLFRSLGLRQAAQASLPGLDSETKSALEAYASGYNAALEDGPSSPEFIALGFAPTPLDAISCLVTFKLIAWQLSGNMLRELENYRLSRKFSFDQMAQLAPAVPGVPEQAWPARTHDVGGAESWLDDVARLMLEGAPSTPDDATGSNAWAVTGEHSQTGKPLLANDPHLGLSAPAVWYLSHLHAPGLNVIGATLPGTPGVWLGRNDHVAWGITNTGSDTQDLYIERLDPTDPTRVLTPDGARAMTQRTEQIRVRGGEPHEFVARATRHGPVVSDSEPLSQQLLAGQAGHVLALAWTGLGPEDRSAQFAIKAAKARDASQLLAAGRDLRSPQQNLVYADDAGAVGLQAIGRLPRRAAEDGVLGRLPVPGWVATYDWSGELTFDELPARTSDAHGRVHNANDAITSPEYPHWITSEWELPYRADRIARLLDAEPQHSLADFARMQQDVRSPLAQELLPELLRKLGDAGSQQYAPLIARLHAWNGSMGRDRPEALVFHAWLENLGERLYPQAYFRVRPVADPRVIAAMVRGEGEVAGFCGGACARHVRESFVQTFETLRARYGDDITHWRWGAHNLASFDHAVFGDLPIVGRLLDLKLARGGSSETINLSATAFDPESGEYLTGIGPSLRALYDLAQPERSQFILAPGQSGNPLSSRYRDLAAPWERGEYLPMITDRAAVQRQPHDTLILSPIDSQQGD